MNGHFLAFEEADGFGGAFVDLAHICLELRKRGMRVSVARSYDGPAWDPLKEAGVTLLRHRRWQLAHHFGERLPAGGLPRKALFGAELLAREVPLGMRYAVWGRLNGVTHVFANNSVTGNPASAITAKALGVPLLSYVQGREDGHHGFRYLAPMARRTFAVANWVGEEIVEFGGDPAALDTLYPGVETPDEHLAAPRPEDGTTRIGMVGMLTPWKGQLRFLDAFARVAAADETVEAWLFGRPLPKEAAYGKAVHERVAELGLTDRVRFVTDCYRPEQIYPLVDFTVHCSVLPEPFGRVVIEAMSYGRPIVAADRGGPTEAVKPGETGLLADPEDAHALANAMLALVKDPERRRAMGACARIDVLRRFAYPHVLQPLLTELARA